ncbi:MAG: hypothetical protein ACREIR_06995 [Geminicoccaceae bacterium]
MLRILATGAALLVSSGASAADYRADVHACAPTVEKWERTHLRKVEGELARFGAWSTGVIRWDSGTRVEATIGPSIDPKTGEPAICVVASRDLGRDLASAQ